MTTGRSFDQLTDNEKEALRMLHQARGITSSGSCDLARSLTGNPKLKATDDVARMYNKLVREHWIVVRDRSGLTNVHYGVSDEYRQLMQLA